MAVQYPRSPRQDLVSPPFKFQPVVPSLFPASDDYPGEEGDWFFNMKIHKTDHQQNVVPPQSPRKPKQLNPMTVKQNAKVSRGHSRTSREPAPNKASRDPANLKPQFRSRNRKLEPMSMPSPAELREQLDCLTARSIGDSLIFHNIPECCDGTPKAEVVKFCHDYLVGQHIKHVQFGQVHKMEPRFSKDAPITARFTITRPRAPPSSTATDHGGQAAAAAQAEKSYRPLPYVPPMPRRRLPLLKKKGRKKTQLYHHAE